MKLFVSYRRDDTGGRAGRLCDVLVTRFGASNVFQDVNAVAPGHDFRVQVEAAIATSDAVLIVIGPDWMGSSGADVGRRIDERNDFVRLEVSLALSSGIPVVPVLVDGAVLPPRDELPDDMTQMLERQAVTIRDTSWHQDVDDLVHRLKGEERLATPARRWPIITAAGLSVVVVVLVVTAIIRNPGGESSEEPPTCDPPGDSWLAVDLDSEPFNDIVDDEEHTIEYTVESAKIDSADRDQVVVQVAVRNKTEPRNDDTDAYYFAGVDVDGLLVNGVFSDWFCFGPVKGGQELQPKDRAISLFGFRTDGIPTGATLALRLDQNRGDVTIGLSP